LLVCVNEALIFGGKKMSFSIIKEMAGFGKQKK
jgi:hypothetical protein